ncbi:MAG: deoxyribodipyrimidine photolyase, partial [Cytophagales bacterium]
NLNLTTRLPSLPKPVIDTTKPTLIYNTYNLDPLWRKDEDANRVLLLEPSHFQKYPVSDKVIEFIIALSRNIANVRIWVGEIGELESLYKTSLLGTIGIISKEHPAFIYYPGQKDAREWMYPGVTGYFGSFFSYWKKCEKQHQ